MRPPMGKEIVPETVALLNALEPSKETAHRLGPTQKRRRYKCSACGRIYASLEILVKHECKSKPHRGKAAAESTICDENIDPALQHQVIRIGCGDDTLTSNGSRNELPATSEQPKTPLVEGVDDSDQDADFE